MSSDCEQVNEYRIFLEALTSIPETSRNSDILRHNSDNYQVSFNELKGEILTCILNHLETNNCPTKLLIPIALSTMEEVEKEFDYSKSALQSENNERFYDLIKLHKFTITSLRNSAARFLDNAEMNKILTNASVLKTTTGSIENFLDEGNHNNSNLLLSSSTPFLPPKPIHAVSTIRNKRRKMEDRHICIDRFDQLYDLKDNRPRSFYGVFDGHRGSLAAAYAASQIPKLIADYLNHNSKKRKNQAAIGISAIKSAILQTDQNFINKQLPCGTTACCVLYCPFESYLYVGWVGDSKAMLAKNGNLIQLVKPHKPNSMEEQTRVRSAGGSLILMNGEWRINGIYNVCRAIGDNDVKEIIADPDGICVQLDGQEDFLVLATDGLWDHASEEEIATIVYRELQKNYVTHDYIPKLLIDLAKKGSATDNITVVVIFFKHQISKKIIISPHIMESAFKTTEMDDFIEERQRELYHHGLNSMHKFGNDELEQLDLSWTNKSVKVDDNGTMMTTTSSTVTATNTTITTDKSALINDGESNLEFSNNFDMNFIKQNQQLTCDEDNNFNHLQQTMMMTTVTTKSNENHENDVQCEIIDNDGLDSITAGRRDHNYQIHQHFDHQQNEDEEEEEEEDNQLDNDCHHQNLEQQQQQQQLHHFGTTIANNTDNDFGPETCVDVTDDAVMMTENSADTNLLEQSTLSHSKDDTLPSSTDNCNPFDNRNVMAVELDANKATPLLSPEVEDLPLSEASMGGIIGGDGGDDNDGNNENLISTINNDDLISAKKLDESYNFEENNYFMQANGHLSPEMNATTEATFAQKFESEKIQEKQHDEKEEEEAIMPADDNDDEDEEEEEEDDGGKSTAELSVSDNANDENIDMMEPSSVNAENPNCDDANLLEEENKPDQEDMIAESLIENIKDTSSNDSPFIEETDNMMHYDRNGESVQLITEDITTHVDNDQKEFFNSVTVLKECHEFKEELEAVNQQIRSMCINDGIGNGGGGGAAAAFDENEMDDISDDNVYLKEEEEILEKHHIEESYGATTHMSPIRSESPQQQQQQQQDEMNMNSMSFPQFTEEIYKKQSDLFESRIGSNFESEFLHSEQDSEAAMMGTCEEKQTPDIVVEKKIDFEKDNYDEVKFIEKSEQQHQEFECVEQLLEEEIQAQVETIPMKRIYDNDEQEQLNEQDVKNTISNDIDYPSMEADTKKEKYSLVNMECCIDSDDDDLKIKMTSNENLLSSQQIDEQETDHDRNRQQQLEYQQQHSTVTDFVTNNEASAESPQSEDEEEWKYIKDVKSEKQGLEKSTVIHEEQEDEDKLNEKSKQEIVTSDATKLFNIDEANVTTQQIFSQTAVEKIIDSASSNLTLHQEEEEQHNIFKKTEDQAVFDLSADAAEADMYSKLNPEAKEFVPSSHSPTSPINIDHLNRSFTIDHQQQQQQRSHHLSNGSGGGGGGGNGGITSPIPNLNATPPNNNVATTAVRHHRLIDDVVAQSPNKGREANMENIMIPEENDFTDDIAKRPHSDTLVHLNNSMDNDLLHINAAAAAAAVGVVAGGGDANRFNDFYQEMNLKETKDDIIVAVNNNNPIPPPIQTATTTTTTNNILENADMKESIYIENDTSGGGNGGGSSSGNEIEDILNTVQPLPIDSESNNSFEIEIENIHDVGSQTLTNKEDLYADFQEKDMVSPSTDEMNEIVTLVTHTSQSNSNVQDVIQDKMEKMLLDHDKQITDGDDGIEEEEQKQQPINGVEMPSSIGDSIEVTKTAPAAGDAIVAVAAAAAAATAVATTAKSIEAAKNAKNITKSAAATAATVNNATKTKVPATTASDAKKSSAAPSTTTTVTTKAPSGSQATATKRPSSSATATSAKVSSSMMAKKPASASNSTNVVANSASATTAKPARAAPTTATAATKPTGGSGGANATLTEKKSTTAPMISNVKPRIDTKPPATLVAKKLQNSLAAKTSAGGLGKNAVTAKLSVTSRTTLTSVSTTSTAKMAARPIASATNNATAANGGGGGTTAKSTANLTTSNANNNAKVTTKTTLTSPRGTHASALRKTEALKSPITKPTSTTSPTTRVSNGHQSTKISATTRTSATATSNATTKTTTTSSSSRTTSATSASRRITTNATSSSSSSAAATTATLLAPKTNNKNSAATNRKSTPIKKPTAGSAHATPIGRKSVGGAKPNSAGTSPNVAGSKTSPNNNNNKTKDAPSSSVEIKITTTTTATADTGNEEGPKMNGSSLPQVDIATEAFEQVAEVADAQPPVPMEIA